MSCHQDPEQLNVLLDGELPAAEAEALYSHLQECVECRKTFQMLQDAHLAFGELEPITVAAGFAERVKGKLVLNGQSKHFRWSRALVGFAAAAAVAVILVGRQTDVPVLPDSIGNQGIVEYLQTMDMEQPGVEPMAFLGLHTQVIVPSLEYGIPCLDPSDTQPLL